MDAHSWLAEPFVKQFCAIFFSILLIAAVAAVIWESVNIATEHCMAKSEKPEHTLEQNACVRTLLPLIRKALMIVLSVLSEFGINTGPLLAGAGIIGLAVGFGSQKLVQDIATGVFSAGRCGEMSSSRRYLRPGRGPLHPIHPPSRPVRQRSHHSLQFIGYGHQHDQALLFLPD